MSDTPSMSQADDSAIVALRARITREMDRKTLFDSIADMTKLVTGPLVAIGCSTLIAAVATATTEAAAILLPCGIGLLAAGAISLTTSIVSSYYSTKINRETSFDRGELDRMRSAQHLVQAMKENQLCITEEKVRDKPWTQTVEQKACCEPTRSL